MNSAFREPRKEVLGRLDWQSEKGREHIWGDVPVARETLKTSIWAIDRGNEPVGSFAVARFLGPGDQDDTKTQT